VKCVGVTPNSHLGWDAAENGQFLTLQGPTEDFPDDLSLLDFAKRLGAATNEGTTLNFRHCYAGLFGAEIAKASGRVTTGSTEPVQWGFCPEWGSAPVTEGPEYSWEWDTMLIFDQSGNQVGKLTYRKRCETALDVSCGVCGRVHKNGPLD
jgi:hypothetical protein